MLRIEKVMKDSLGDLKDFFRKRKHFGEYTTAIQTNRAMDSTFSDNLTHMSDWLKSSSLLRPPGVSIKILAHTLIKLYYCHMLSHWTLTIYSFNIEILTGFKIIKN